MKEMASIGDCERTDAYCSALQMRMFSGATSITVILMNLNPLTSVFIFGNTRFAVMQG